MVMPPGTEDHAVRAGSLHATSLDATSCCCREVSYNAVRAYLEAVLHGRGGEERDTHNAQEGEVQVADVGLAYGKGGGREKCTAWWDGAAGG